MEAINDMPGCTALALDATVESSAVTDAMDSGSVGLGLLPGPQAHCWRIRRAFVRARRALLNRRLREVSKSMAQIRGLLAASDSALRAHYDRALIELRACVAVAEDDLPRARALLLDSMRAAASPLSRTLLRYVQWASGEPTEITEHVSCRARPQRHVLELVLTLSLNAALEFEHLRPTVAGNLAAEALRLATERYGAASSVSCLPAVLLAQIAYEQGRLPEAESLIRSRAAVIRASGALECVLRACVVLARISLHRGRNAEALASLREAETVGRTRKWPRLISAVRAEQARLFSMGAHTTIAHRAPEPAGFSSDRAPKDDVSPRYSSLQSALARIASPSVSLNVEDRHRILISCLRIGATRGLHRVFVDAGAPILRLLETLHDDTRLHEEHSFDLRLYVGLLLRAAVPTATQARQAASPVHQQLSPREKAILSMIARGMSNKRIALDLGIAPETVKSHTKSIFLKLETRTRAQAVARAASMDLA
jgi:ATP/maltotriose-dependent transcriptional regulator MalT